MCNKKSPKPLYLKNLTKLVVFAFSFITENPLKPNKHGGCGLFCT
ncbi:hypothetical protein Phi48:2_gp02 [Cellulophaga phage phi48:2]|nr:hypothetical protein Phi48:2_gp02 [Cellulophaga phage phi48:2]AGO47250.1 hypothetical protein Phi48:2_gp02 [Cellulophaga phage phi48:2]